MSAMAGGPPNKLAITQRRPRKGERKARALLSRVARISERARSGRGLRVEDKLLLKTSELKALYRVGSAVAAHTWLKIAADPERWGPMAAIAAARELTDRDQGRPTQAIAIDHRSYVSLLVAASEQEHAQGQAQIIDASPGHALNSSGEYDGLSLLPSPARAIDAPTPPGGLTPVPPENTPGLLSTGVPSETDGAILTQTPPGSDSDE